MNVIELRTEKELKEAFPVMCQLRSHLDQDTYTDLMRLLTRRGYRLFAIRDEDNAIVALCGITINASLTYGRHVWIHDLVTTEEGRSRGYGQKLVEYMQQIARAEECSCIATSSLVDHTDAHRFYEQHVAFERVAYVYQKMLD